MIEGEVFGEIGAGNERMNDVQYLRVINRVGDEEHERRNDDMQPVARSGAAHN